MIETISLAPGVTLRCFADNRFKHGCLSIQLVRPMGREASLNALLPAVLLRGCKNYPDLRSITLHLDDLYGASVGTLVRRVGEYQTTGISAGFMEDRFALEGEQILAGVVDFMRQLFFEPLTREGGFLPEFVEGEKRNLIAALEAQRNDKRAYAAEQLLRRLCQGDSFAIARLGETPWVAEITPQALYEHYKKLLQESPVDVFYVGSAPAEQVAALLQPMFAGLQRQVTQLGGQKIVKPGEFFEEAQQMDINQGKLSMGFTTPVCIGHEDFAAMQVLNNVFGGGMTAKLFTQLREKMSLCYDISSGYYGTKGLLTVSAGIDSSNEMLVRREIMAQLEACCRGEITDDELENAKQAMRSSLRGTHDAPGSIENYYATAALSGLGMTPEAYMQAVKNVTKEDAARAARSLTLGGVFFLKGVTA